MRAKIVRAVILVLVILLLSLVLLEGVLWFIDPLGIATYVTDLSLMVTIANAEGYTLAPGRHELRYWSYTIDESGNRVMPVRGDNGCTIAFVGDSITFGQGVNDEDTFAYKFASANPDVQFINRGKIAYNIANISASVANTAADGYIYFVSDNDDGLPWMRPESQWGLPRQLPPRLAAIQYYLATFREINLPSVGDRDGFWSQFEALYRRDDVAFFLMGSPLADEIAVRYPAIPLIPRWTVDLKVSWIDGHPNPAGHDYLLERMSETIAAFIEQRCQHNQSI
jgi:hypothetical protein